LLLKFAGDGALTGKASGAIRARLEELRAIRGLARVRELVVF
jgi:hypothetical protein